MNLVEPKVYLVGRSGINLKGLNDYLTDINRGVKIGSSAITLGTDSVALWTVPANISGSELLCMLAGKTCYDSIGRGKEDPKSYLGHIIEMGHGSVLEHVSWNFIITGVSRTFSHEHVRHRAGCAISQRSQRYVNESEASIIPQPLVEANPEAKKVWEEAIQNSQEAYAKLLDILEKDLSDAMTDKTSRLKVLRSAARSVMPNATETVIFWSANARALRHYIEMRASSAAEIEIRRVANQIYEIMLAEAPSMFSDYDRTNLADGTFELTTPNVKA